jgi:hypothetical protein
MIAASVALAPIQNRTLRLEIKVNGASRFTASPFTASPVSSAPANLAA